MLIGDFLGWVVVEKFEVFRFEFGVSGSIDPGGDRFSRGRFVNERLRQRQRVGGGDLPTPPCRAPLSCRFFILGEPQNKNAAPGRGFSSRFGRRSVRKRLKAIE
jgi:hypothetical protein